MMDAREETVMVGGNGQQVGRRSAGEGTALSEVRGGTGGTRSRRVAAALVTMLMALMALPPPATITAAASSCSGNFSDVTMPSTINVLLTKTGPERVQSFDFEYYVKNVLPNEWSASWPMASLQAGAMAVKDFGWNFVNNWRGGSYNGTCYNVVDNINDQNFVIGSEQPSTDAAVSSTWSWLLRQNAQVFETHYNSGNPGDSCGHETVAGYMDQNATKACAQQGMPWYQILRTYYGGVTLALGDFTTWATRNQDGRLEILPLGQDNSIWDNWQSSPGAGWNGWQSRGGGPFLGDAPVGINAGGHLEMFATTPGGIVEHNWQNGPGGPWNGWVSLGGAILSTPAVGRNLDGRLEIFAQGADGALWHDWQNSPGGSWSGWSSLGGNVVGTPAVAANYDGRLEVFVEDASTTALDHIWQTSPNGDWSGFSSLGGTLDTSPAVGFNADGRLEAFFAGPDSAMYHTYQLSPGGLWISSPQSLGGSLSFNNAPAVSYNADGRLQVFVRDSSNSVDSIWQSPTQSGWSTWVNVGGSFIGGPAVAVNAGGTMEMFAVDSGGTMEHTWQTSPNGSWSGLHTLGGVVLAG